MKASNTLIKKLKEFEGYRDVAYRDSAGVLTIGFGTTRNVKEGMTCTEEQAERWLREDLELAERFVSTIPEIDTQGKFDAVVDFVYNCGIGAFESSTLLKKIKSHAPTEEIQAQFRRWVYAKGIELPGLVKRRNWEAERWAE